MRVQSKLKIVLSFFVALFFASACTNLTKDEPVPKMDSLVSVAWLNKHLNDSDLVVIDSTVVVKLDAQGKYSSVSGRADYEAGHIPSAGFADILGNLSGGDGSMELIMPTPEQFSLVMGALGVSNDSRVVIYSGQDQSWAARLWWMLRWAGFDQVAILDGGLNAWKAEGLPVSIELPNRPRQQFNFVLREEVIADRDEVFAAIGNSQVSIIDALPEAHYQGMFSMYARPGHITGATNIPTSELVESGFYQSKDELDLKFDGERSNRVITYCGGGIVASSLAFALFRSGFTDVAVYMGSLQEWTLNPENPMTVGAAER